MIHVKQNQKSTLFFKKLFLLVTISPLVTTLIQSNHSDQLLAIVLMVKNEEDVMEKTLNPFLQAGIQQYLILDTGSTDLTIKKTDQLLKDYNIQDGHIIEQPFIDFSTSRNYALECAEQLFPHTKFFLMIDAEWCMQNVNHLLTFCAQNDQEHVDAFAIQIHFQQSQYFVRRLFNAQKKVRFIRKIHEYANVKSYKTVPSHIHIKWENSLKGYEKSKARWQKDLEFLLEEHQQNPHDLRTIFFIGQTYYDLQDLEKAAFWFQKRYDLESSPSEEKFQACYRLGIIYQKQHNYSRALHYYQTACDLNPNRAEPLIQIALHYLEKKDFQTSFLLAQKACSIPYPQNASIVNIITYQYTRYTILAITALSLQEYETGKNALQKALEHFSQDQLLSELQATYKTLNL